MSDSVGAQLQKTSEMDVEPNCARIATDDVPNVSDSVKDDENGEEDAEKSEDADGDEQTAAPTENVDAVRCNSI